MLSFYSQLLFCLPREFLPVSSLSCLVLPKRARKDLIFVCLYGLVHGRGTWALFSQTFYISKLKQRESFEVSTFRELVELS